MHRIPEDNPRPGPAVNTCSTWLKAVHNKTLRRWALGLPHTRSCRKTLQHTDKGTVGDQSPVHTAEGHAQWNWVTCEVGMGPGHVLLDWVSTGPGDSKAQ